jgi:hypothetical protein
MRVRSCFTGVEYEKLLEFLRRFHDIPSSATPPVEPSPKRLIFSQPISELHEDLVPKARPDAGAQPAPAQGNVQPQPAPAQGNAQPLPAAGAGLPNPLQAPTPPPVRPPGSS